MCVRVRTDLNNSGVRDIIKFFYTAVNEIFPKDRDKVEFLIKFDSDDNKFLTLIKEFSRFPLKIRLFSYSRWEGMETAHYNYTYLLNRINSESKFIIFCGDDSVPKNLNISILEKFKDNNYLFFSSLPRMSETEWLAKSSYTPPFSKCMNDLNSLRLVEPYPVISRKLLEICSGAGFCSNVDGWLALLNVILFNKYNILLTKNLPNLMFSRDNTQKQDMFEDNFTSNWNRDMENLPYYFDLLNQQAKNIYLNIKEDKL